MFILLVSQSGCLAPASLQSGRTIGKGNAELSFGITSGRYDQNNPSFAADDTNQNYVPIIEMRRTSAINESTDFSLEFNSLTFLSADIKHQLLGNRFSLIAGSIGAELGIAPIGALSGAIISSVSVPVYISVHPANTFCLYATPRYTYGFKYIYARGSLSPGYHTFANFFGLSYGIIISEKHKVSIEASHFEKNLLKPSQISVGYSFPHDFTELFF